MHRHDCEWLETQDVIDQQEAAGDRRSVHRALMICVVSALTQVAVPFVCHGLNPVYRQAVGLTIIVQVLLFAIATLLAVMVRGESGLKQFVFFLFAVVLQLIMIFGLILSLKLTFGIRLP